MLAGRLVLREALSVGGAPWLRSPLPDARSIPLATAETIAEPLGRQSDLDAVRGWLASEAGR